jgi:hypothetical protein
MGAIFEVTYEDINRLNAIQLTDFLMKLLSFEADDNNIPASSIKGSLRITVSDEGEDVSIKWKGSAKSTDWIPSRYTLFQCKATSMPRSKCKEEFNKEGIKTKIDQLFISGGSYILFTTEPCTRKMEDERVKGFRETLRESGKSYADTADIKVYDANKIARWSNKYIAAIKQVCNYVSKPLPSGIISWEQWAGYSENRSRYVTDEILSDNIKTLQDHYISEQRIARIIGLSGLGKSRLAFEAFRPPEDINDNLIQSSLSNQAVYINAVEVPNLPSILSEWRTLKLSGTVIVDNCEIELHERLAREIIHEDSKLNLLTLDFIQEQQGQNCRYIQLEGASETVIKGVLKDAYPALSGSDISRIYEFSQGFPQIAVLLAQARLNEEPDIGNLKDDILVKKLLWGRGQEQSDALKVISTCAIFSHLGFYDEVAEQRKFVAEHICSLSNQDFYSLAQDFINRGILDRRHRYVRVVPLPLAIRLAADWWRKYPPERAKEILSLSFPGRLLESLCDQIANLHFLPETQELVKEICGEQAPFGQAKVLNSDKGSRLFRSLVEVNPEATIEALERVFSGWSTKKIRDELGPGRRNLVWALENLCFWESTFLSASRLLLAFAAGENETWGNNATNQFLQMYHYMLSGTQAPPHLRLKVLDEALSSDEPEYLTLATKALGAALTSHHFSRRGGVETQGSRLPQEDWKPKVWGEVFDYWRECINRLIPLACRKDELGTLARMQIANNLRGLVQHGRIEELDKAISEITENYDELWIDLRKKIYDIMRNDGKSIPKEGKEKIDKWLELIKPVNIVDKIKMYVSVPSWMHYKDEDGHYTDLALNEANEFAKKCAGNITEFMQNMHCLFTGEQRKGFSFGYKLAELIEKPALFIEKSIDILSSINNSGNPIVLGGFLNALRKTNPKLVTSTLDEIISNPKTLKYILELTRYSLPDKKDISRVLKLVHSGDIHIQELRAFTYGSVLDHESTDTMMDFCEELIGFGDEAVPVALEILFMYCYTDKTRFDICRETFRKIILYPGIISNHKRARSTDDYHWQEVASMLLNVEEGDIELAIFIVNETLKACKEYNNIYIEYMLTPILRILLTKYRDDVWPLISKALLSEDDDMLKYNLIDLLNQDILPSDSASRIIHELPDDFLIAWCNSNSNAPVILSRLIRLLVKKDDELSWHPVVKFIIDNYGHIEDVQNAIVYSLGPTSWSGSIVPYYEDHLKAFELLAEHEKAEIKEWSSRMRASISKVIDAERKRESERDFGIFQ